MSNDMVFDLDGTINKAYSILYSLLGGEKKKHSEVYEEAERTLSLLRIDKKDSYYTTICKAIVDAYEVEVGVKSYNPDVMINPESASTWLLDKKDKKKHAFFSRYKQYLLKEGFSRKSVDNIELSTEKILSCCADPESLSSDEKRRGLVVGDVQSGKTANYLGLVNMAYDYGYNLVVILAGLTDALRVQTQRRTDEGVIGAVSDSIGNEIVYCGVGLPNKDEHYVIPFTNQENDFSDFINRNLNATINDFKKPVILVVKKNKKILESVKSKLQSAVSGYKSNSILIIDDEADNASISTAKPGNNPTAINRCIRDIFNEFPVATYVGFTATPFANIFINPEDKDPDDLDLFPSDFIIQLNAPDMYFGGDKIFNNEDYKKGVIRILDETEPNFLPVKHKNGDSFYTLPLSLEEAINVFLINNVIRTIRGQKTKHRSMMINISRFNAMQFSIKYAVNAYVEKIKKVIEQDSYKRTEDFIKNEKMKAIYDVFNGDFYEEIRKGNPSEGVKPIYWEDIQNGLNEEIQQFIVEIINAKIAAANRFDYDDYKDVGARVIAIGGFVLSRGLTLEGLMVSYYSRNATAYDVLLQMGRWFGYRPKYEDLCRVYMSEDNVDSYNAVLEAVENLKMQFREMINKGKKPRDFGLMVKECPDTLETSLLVTSRNKMRDTEVIEYHLNYGGEYPDTSKIPLDKAVNDHNTKAVLEFYNKIKVLPNAFKTNGSKKESRYLVQHVSQFDVADFIQELKISYYNKKFDKDNLSDYIRKSNVYPYWDVVIATGTHDFSNSSVMKQFDLVTDKKMPSRKFRLKLYVNEDGDYELEDNLIRIGDRNNRILDPGIFDAGIDITPEMKEKRLKEKDIDDPKKAPHSTLTAKDYLKFREYPILVIYPMFLSPVEDNDIYKKKLEEVFDKEEPIFGFAIGFPSKESSERVKYRINKVKMEELSKQIIIDEDEEEEDE